MPGLRRYCDVDVFATGPLSGNPLAVVIDSGGLSDEQMQSFASWTNLSETTFLLPATDASADYLVRIFTPTRELPFAGHPTLGSAHAWLGAGGTPRSADFVVQQCGVGNVTVRRTGADSLAFAAPPRTRTGPLDEATLATAIAVLGCGPDDVVAHEWGVNGPPWAMVQLASAEAVRAVRPNMAQIGDTDLGVIGLEPPGSPVAYELRAFVPPPAPAEDPVTGSLNAAAAQWLRQRGLVPGSYRAAQGSQLGRAGEILIEDDGVDIWVGGRVTTRVTGTLDL